jgi:hypothetical protein
VRTVECHIAHLCRKHRRETFRYSKDRKRKLRQRDRCYWTTPFLS